MDLSRDNYKAKGNRQRLIDELRKKGITAENVLRVMNNIPRHIFIDSAFFEYAYDDKPFPIGSEQTISHPYTVAFQTQLLEVSSKDKILEIGTGSGYQTAVLVELGAKIYSIERILTLYNKTKILLEANNYFAKLFYGDGYKGLPNFAPFDKILVTCGAPSVPEELKKQLTIGGIMVVPVGNELQRMYRITRKSETEYITDDFGDFKFVPMLEERSK